MLAFVKVFIQTSPNVSFNETNDDTSQELGGRKSAKQRRLGKTVYGQRPYTRRWDDTTNASHVPLKAVAFPTKKASRQSIRKCTAPMVSCTAGNSYSKVTFT